MDHDASHWISTVRASQERLRALVEPLDTTGLRGPSYASDWSIAQVMSHLGSGAEIFSLFLDAALAGSEPPGVTQFEPIWTRWNAKSPEAQASDSLAADADFVERMGSLDPVRRDGLHLTLFGMDIDMIGLLRMRLGEHAVHSWDVAVALDDTATVAPDAMGLLVDTLDQLVARVGRPTGDRRRVAIHTTDPGRSLVLDIAEHVTLTPDGGDVPDAELRIPSEALLRLVYGRLDPAHTPPFDANGVDLDVLRAVFPGL